MRILFISPFLSKNSVGGPALRAKNSLKIIKKLGEVQVIDLEDYTPLNWSGNKKINQHEQKTNFKDQIQYFLFSSFSRISQIIEIIFQFFSLNCYKKICLKIDDFQPEIIWFSYSTNFPKLFLKLKKNYNKIYFVADTEAVISSHFERCSKEISGSRSLFYKILSIKRLKEENEILSKSNLVTAVSELDALNYKMRNISKNISLFPNVIQVNNTKRNFSLENKNPTLLITGSFGGKESAMTHGTKWFIEQVFSEILNKFENIELYVVGKNASNLTKFCKVTDNIKIYSDVLSLNSFFEKAWCAICPLFFESGTRFKILEAAEKELVTISTTLGAEGLNLEPGKEIIISDTAEQFVTEVLKILDSRKLRQDISQNAKQKTIEYYSIEAGLKFAQNILNSVKMM